MADNPLFPGYSQRKQGEVPGNPFFPGYQEGQRAYRPAGGQKIQPFEYNADAWLDQVDGMSADISNIPKWFVDKYVDDFKSNLKAVYSPGAIPVEQMDDYDQDVLPGVSSISLSLNPSDWAEPEKILEKTAKSWIKAGTGLKFKKLGWGLEAMPIDLTDYDTNVRASLWKVALGVQEPNDVSSLGRKGGIAVARTTRAMSGEGITAGKEIFNFKDADYLVSQKRAYETVALKAVDVERNIKAGQRRDVKHDDFMLNTILAVNQEINGNYEFQAPVLDSQGQQVISTAGIPVFSPEKRSRRDLFKEALVKPNSSQADDFERAAKIFELKQNLAVDMSSPATGDGIYGPFGIVNALKARVSGNHDDEKTWRVPNVAGGTESRLDNKLEAFKAAARERLADSGDNSIKETLEKLRKLDPASALAVEKHAIRYQKFLEKAIEVVDKYRGNDRALLNHLSTITVDGKELSGGGLFNPSIQRDLMRQIQSDIILPGKFTKVNKNLQIGTYLSTLESAQLKDLFEREGQDFKGFFANKARMVATRVETDRSSYAIEEFYDAVTDGQVLERYVWNQLSKKMTGYTPGELVQKGLSRVGHFGLVIDDDQISNKLKNNVVFSSVFRHTFKIEVGGIKQRLAGSSQLAAVASLAYPLSFANKISDENLGRLITGQISLANAFKDASYSKFLPGFWNKDTHLLEMYQAELDSFKKWLENNASKFGIKIANFDSMGADDQKKLIELFNALSKENSYYGSLKITKEFSGLLQRVGVSLNKLQDKLFGIPIFQKFIRPFLQAKTIVSEWASEKVATLLSKLVRRGVDAATGGASAIFSWLIEKVIKPVIRVITRKVIEYTQNFVGAIVQGDISKAMAVADKEMQNIVKFSMYLIGIPFLILAALIMASFNTIVTSVSPIDPTKDNSGYSLLSAGWPQGENALIRIEKDVTINGVLNPTDSIPEEDLPVTANYTIRIMPKVDIEGIVINFTDEVKLLNEKGEVTIYTPFNNSEAGPFVAGEIYEFTFSLNITSSYNNSLIKNVLSVKTPAYESTSEETVTFIRYVRVGVPPLPMDCFVFENFPGAEQQNFEAALWNISSRTGNFLNKLCSDPETPISPTGQRGIILRRIGGGSGYCGLASSSGVVTFNDVCESYYTRLDATSYLLAHELGHMFNYYVLSVGTPAPNFPQGFSSVKGMDGGTLPTYDGNCSTENNVDEDFAETIGDMVEINRFGTCADEIGGGYNLNDPGAFWAKFPAHQQFANEVIFQ